ncbi:MAG TPA: DsbA family protein [Trueperaceae bacterium]|nr:DsbA family protein [Trueperaceae bacterium]
MPERVTVYFDYICPFSWRAAELFALISEPLGLDVRWEHFSLYQSEHARRAPGAVNAWQLWNEPLDRGDGGGCKGLLPFLASLAARKQGAEAHDAFRLALQRANHMRYQPFNGATVAGVANEVGLDLALFEHELANPECRTVLAQEHMRAAARDIFGTPTVVFPSGHTAYLRIQEVPRSVDEGVALFQDVRRMLERYPYLQTVRRPRTKGN